MLDFNFLANIEYCRDFVLGVKPLLYYTHLPAMFISLLIGLYIFIKSRKVLLSKLFFLLVICFSTWTFLNLTIWLSYDKSSIVMAAWSSIEVFSILIYLISFYFLYVFYFKNDIPYYYKIAFTLIISFVVFTNIAGINLLRYDLTECIAVENGLIQQIISYIKLFLACYITLFSFYIVFKSKKNEYIKNGLLCLGIIIFIVSFYITGLYSEVTGNFKVELFGLLGMLVFIGVLAYLIVKYQEFNTKLIGAEMLVTVLVITVFSQLAFVDSLSGKILVYVSSFISIIFGYFLVKSVQKEVQTREALEKLSQDLLNANTRLLELDKQKSEFVSFATHQLKSPLAAMKGYASLLLDGDYGEISEKMKEPVKRIYESAKTLAIVVEDYLNISRIELGTMKYNFGVQDLKAMVSDVIAEIRPTIDQSGLDFSFESKEENIPFNADPDKLQQVFLNIIDNSIKYTKSGFIKVKLEKKDKQIYFTVEDSGIGMSRETIAKLFEKFSRAYNANKTNIHGTGLGLFVAKEIVKAHGGEIKAESGGEGKGSKFIVVLKGR